MKYRHNYTDTVFDEVNVYHTWWNNYEVYLVDFHKSLIESVTIDNIYFSTVTCDDTLFYKVIFNNMYFEYGTKIYNSKFRNCIFNKCVFKDINFLNTKFVECEFNNSSFRDCKLNIGISGSTFNNFDFTYCVIPADRKSFESENNKFNNIDIRMCVDRDRILMSNKDFMKYLVE